MSALFPRQVNTAGDNPGVWYWDALVSQLRRADPRVAVRYLLDLGDGDVQAIDDPDFSYHLEHGPGIQSLGDAVPLWRGHANFRAVMQNLAHQTRMVRR